MPFVRKIVLCIFYASHDQFLNDYNQIHVKGYARVYKCCRASVVYCLFYCLEMGCKFPEGTV